MQSESRSRLAVAKTAKLYLNGKFLRSESGRSYPVNDVRGRFLGNVVHASRRAGEVDVREMYEDELLH